MGFNEIQMMSFPIQTVMSPVKKKSKQKDENMLASCFIQTKNTLKQITEHSKDQINSFLKKSFLSASVEKNSM